MELRADEMSVDSFSALLRRDCCHHGMRCAEPRASCDKHVRSNANGQRLRSELFLWQIHDVHEPGQHKDLGISLKFKRFLLFNRYLTRNLCKVAPGRAPGAAPGAGDRR